MSQPGLQLPKRTSESVESNAHHFPPADEETEEQRGDRICLDPLVPGSAPSQLATLAGQEDRVCLAEPVAQGSLTILAVVEDVHFALLGPQQGLR